MPSSGPQAFNVGGTHACIQQNSHTHNLKIINIKNIKFPFQTVLSHSPLYQVFSSLLLTCQVRKAPLSNTHKETLVMRAVNFHRQDSQSFSPVITGFPLAEASLSLLDIRMAVALRAARLSSFQSVTVLQLCSSQLRFLDSFVNFQSPSSLYDFAAKSVYSYLRLFLHQVMQRHLLTCHPASDAVESRLVHLSGHTLLLWFSL